MLLNKDMWAHKSFLPNKSKELYLTMFGYNDRIIFAIKVEKIKNVCFFNSSLHCDASIDLTHNGKKSRIYISTIKQKEVWIHSINFR